MQTRIVRVDRLPDDIGELAEGARAEAFRALDRLIAEFRNGSNTFDAPGEALFCAYLGSRLVGVAGLNRDPFGRADRGRVRRLFVAREARRQGVGRALVDAVARRAIGHFTCLSLYTSSAEAARFYEALGFQRTESLDRISHTRAIAA